MALDTLLRRLSAGVLVGALSVSSAKAVEDRIFADSFETRRVSYCTQTQQFYGNAANFDCLNRSAQQVIEDALDSLGNSLTIGSLFPENLVLITGDGACIIGRLPGSGPAGSIGPGTNNQSNACADMPGIVTFGNGQLQNILVAQAIALNLNLGLDNALGTFVIPQGFDFLTTVEAMDCYTNNSLPDPNGSPQDFFFPTTVSTYLNNPNMYGVGPNVNGLKLLVDFEISGGILDLNLPPLIDIANAAAAINEAFSGCRVVLGWGNNPEETNGEQAALELRLHGFDINVFPEKKGVRSCVLHSQPTAAPRAMR